MNFEYKYKNKKLRDFLETKKAFKLICGANNENYKEITKLVDLYSKAGVRFFDINASARAISACKNALKDPDNSFICVSIGTKNDPHLAKCKVNSNCTNCGLCQKICPQSAIKKDKTAKINEKYCIGCKKCLKICKYNAIESYQKELQFNKILDEIKSADCIEFHVINDNKQEIFEKWQYLVNNYEGFLSIALNKSLYSEKELFEILSTMVNMAKSKDVMIQADGKSMSGGIDDFNSTLQAVATADSILKFNLNVPVIISGGTNSKSFELAKICNVDINGVAIGSYARKIVKGYLEGKDSQDNALKTAKELVD